jgi:hypothetical protein
VSAALAVDQGSDVLPLPPGLPPLLTDTLQSDRVSDSPLHVSIGSPLPPTYPTLRRRDKRRTGAQ